MESVLAAADQAALVAMVKLSQQRRMKGSKGGWKDFLGVYDKELGNSVSDPAKRSVETLADFIKTFNKEEDVKIFEKLLECHSNKELVAKAPDVGSPEQSLVRLTVTHPRFTIDYSLPTHEEGWIVMDPKEVRADEMVAIAGQMVLCEDGTEALVKICIVDRNLEVKLDELLKPEKPVKDYRTQVTGVKAKILKGVSCSLSDIQQSMKRILSRETILIGHGLNNVLKALKLEHPKVIDTSYIFKYADETIGKKPSFDNVCKFVLGSGVRKSGDPHNCLDDARCLMKIVLAKIERRLDGLIPLVQKDKPLVPGTGLPKLYIHQIPVYVTTEDLYRAIPGDHNLEIEPRNHLESYWAIATYKSLEDADLAFETLSHNSKKDSSGIVVGIECDCKKKCNIKVQRMAFGSSKKRVVPDSKSIPNESKKLKAGIETVPDVLPHKISDHSRKKIDLPML